jgi:hypothetical protein
MKEEVVLLDHKKELQGAIEGIEASKSSVTVKTLCANPTNFDNCFLEHPKGLHFSGHGYPNTE